LLTCFEFWKKKNPKYIFVATIDRPALKILPNKTNPHKTVKPRDWWMGFLQANFPEHNINTKYTRFETKTRFTIFFEK
jgi:hypothetical protein